jgi:hypothetical protein
MICALRDGAVVSHLSSSAPLEKGVVVVRRIVLLARPLWIGVTLVLFDGE